MSETHVYEIEFTDHSGEICFIFQPAASMVAALAIVRQAYGHLAASELRVI